MSINTTHRNEDLRPNQQMFEKSGSMGRIAKVTAIGATVLALANVAASNSAENSAEQTRERNESIQKLIEGKQLRVRENKDGEKIVKLRIKPGDTLWDLGRDIVGESEDVRKFTSEMSEQLSEMGENAGSLRSGMELTVSPEFTEPIIEIDQSITEQK